MPGYFDDWSPTTGLLDPRIGGWFGLTQGLLSAGAPSRMPTNLGGALAQGLGGMAQGTQSSLAMRRAALENQLAELNYGKQATLLGIARGALNGSPDQGQQGGPPLGRAGDPSQPPTGFSTGLLGDPNSPQMGAPPQPGPVASPPTGPAGGAPTQVGGFPIPPGMNSQSFALSLLSPEMSKLYAPTNEQKNSRDPYLGAGTIQQVARSGMTDIEKLQAARQVLTSAGVPESDPRVKQIDAAIFKTNDVAPIDAKPGTPVIQRGPQGTSLLAYAPKVDDGINLSFGRDKSGALVSNGANVVPNYIPSATSISGAVQGAKEANSIQSGVDSSGSTVKGWGYQVFPGGGARLPSATSPGAIPPALSAPRLSTGGSPGPLRSPGLGDEAAATVSAKSYAADTAASAGYANRMFTLQKSLDALQGANTGPRTESVNEVKSMFNAMTPDALKRMGVGFDPEKIKSWDEAQKYLTQYALAQASSLGESTDSKLATVLSGNANTKISNLAAQDVVRANLSMERMNNALVAESQKQNVAPRDYTKWRSQTVSALDPRVFAWDTMDAGSKQRAMQTMSPADQTRFRQNYNLALQNGYIPGPQQPSRDF